MCSQLLESSTSLRWQVPMIAVLWCRGVQFIKAGTELSEEVQGRIKVSAQCLIKIKNMLYDLDPGFTLAQYLYEIDQFGDLLWHAEYRAGAVDEEEFEESYPIPAPVLEAIEHQSRGGGPPGDGCFHCGMFGHNARVCPFGGSRSYEQGKNIKYGTRPRCFVCANNAPDHYSPSCPYRHPDSYAPVAVCSTCKHALQGRKQHASKCPNCNNPLRCWNCGRQGHRLNRCPEPRYKPGGAAYNIFSGYTGFVAGFTLARLDRRGVAGFVADVSGFVADIAGFVADVAGFVADIACFVSDVAGFVADVTGFVAGFVADVAGFLADIAGFVNDIAGFVADIAGFALARLDPKESPRMSSESERKKIDNFDEQGRYGHIIVIFFPF
ncbi:hypothetical protein niasHT_020117 [Heterodera trifolii]|uniref:CCHC-type domain-containing protein n=1 Tax=Heterodera trifolii TaxID=157864 RepID=A0ABD2IWT9_9BILA